MAIVDLNYVQFWQPSLNPRPSKQRDSVSHARKNAESSLTIISCKQQALLDYEEIGEGDKQRNLAVAIAQHQQQRFTTAKEDNLNRNQGLYNTSVDLDNTNTPSLPVEEILGHISSKGVSTGSQNFEETLQHGNVPALNIDGNQFGPNRSGLDNGEGKSYGTQARPVILEDGELSNFNPKTTVTSTDSGADSVCDPGQPLQLSRDKAWRDGEDGFFIGTDLHPFGLPEEDGLVSAPSHDQSPSRQYSPEISEDQIDLHDNNEAKQDVSSDLIPHFLLRALGKVNRERRYETGSRVEEDLPVAYEEQEQLPLASTPEFPHPHRPSAELPHLHIDPEHGDKLEKVRHGSPLHRHDLRSLVATADPHTVVREVEEGTLGQSGSATKRRHQDKAKEISSGIRYSEDGAPNTDDEGSRPTKKLRKLSKPVQKSPTPRPSATQLEVDGDMQSQADSEISPTLIDNTQQHPPQTSQRSPFTPTKSLPAAEYQEWPFQGFLKRTIIGNEIMYNLEFQLPHLPERLCIPVHSEALGVGLSKETSTKASSPHKTAAHSKVQRTTLQARRKRVPWTPEENKTITPDEEGGLLVGRDLCCTPAPDIRGDPGTVLYETQN